MRVDAGVGESKLSIYYDCIIIIIVVVVVRVVWIFVG